MSKDTKARLFACGGAAFFMLVIALSIAFRSGWPAESVLPTVLVPIAMFALMRVALRALKI
jgi:hypothetical protein